MDPFEQLLTSSSSKRATPDMLEMLGHQAARAFIDNKVPLNDAVAAAVKDHPELGNEHVKRIIEFANNVTFQEIFQSGEDKNVHFPVADPGVVLRDLKDGGSPGHEEALGGSTKDYSTAPEPQMQKADELQDGFNDLANREQNSGIFGQGEPIQKNAYAANFEAEEHANPYENVYDLHVSLVASKNRLREAADHFTVLEKRAAEELYSAVKKEILDPTGAGLGGVLSVMQKVAGTNEAITLLEPLVQRLIVDGVRVEQLENGLEKRAGSLVNYNHSIPQALAGMMKAIEEGLGTELALEEVEVGLAKTAAFLARGA